MKQTDEIKEYLKMGKSLTPIEALERFGCFRLAARVSDLKREGEKIMTDIVYDKGKRYASYRMETTA